MSVRSKVGRRDGGDMKKRYDGKIGQGFCKEGEWRRGLNRRGNTARPNK
jgi:hypothetical protein